LGKPAQAEPVTVALMPLKNITIQGDEEWFTDGMTEALITELAQISGLRITSRASVMKYKEISKSAPEIADDLGVSYLIEGSLSRAGEKIKIATRLIDTSQDGYIWARSYERNYEDILTLQGEIAQAIASQISVELTPQEQNRMRQTRVISTEAQDAYFKGRFHWSKLTSEDLTTAIEYFQFAVEKDSTFAQAYAGISLTWLSRAQMGYVSSTEAHAKAKLAVSKALALDSTLAEIYFVKAGFNMWGEWKFEESAQNFKRSLALNPNLADAHAYYSHVLYTLHQPEKALEHIKTAIAIDPFNTLFKSIYAMDLNYEHRYIEAIDLLLGTLEQSPNNPITLSTLRTSYHLNKEYNKAIEIWEKSYAQKNDYAAIEALKSGYEEGGYHLALQRVAELFIERKKTKYVTSWQISTLYARAGLHDEALTWLEKAYEEHDNNMPYLSIDPIFDEMRSNSRFQNLLRQMDLPIL
jgi:TolB-like protein/Tfp pilus assembly protein PilF